MKTFTTIVLLALFCSGIFPSCQTCEGIRAKTLSRSIWPSYKGDFNVTLNGGSAQKIKGRIEFISRDDNTVSVNINLNPYFYLDSSPKYIIYIDNPVTLQGKPYDISFEYTGPGRIIKGNDEYEDPELSFKGWMKEGNAPTRCSPQEYGLGYLCEIVLEYTSEGDNYNVLISPYISH